MGMLEDYFKGKTILISGMGSGQGTATAKLIEKLGGNVIGLSRNGNPPVGNHPGISVIKCDVGKQEDLEKLKETLSGTKIHGLVNNAGKWESATDLLVPPNKLTDFFMSNVNTQYSTIVSIKDIMEKHSSIVNIGASRNLLKVNHAGYSISKYAIEEMTRIAASSLRDKMIRVNAVLPGSVSKEDSFQRTFPHEFPHTGNISEPLEIANISAFLLSPFSFAVNGQCITADRGLGL